MPGCDLCGSSATEVTLDDMNMPLVPTLCSECWAAETGESGLQLVEDILDIVSRLGDLPLADRTDALNKIRAGLVKVSPFESEPVDSVRWVQMSNVSSNDYNPNAVAPPEMKLLRHSIAGD